MKSSEIFEEAKNGKNDNWTDVFNNGAKSTEINRNDYEISAEYRELNISNWVGFGDSVDYFELTISDAGKYKFDITATDNCYFTIYQLLDTGYGNYLIYQQSTYLFKNYGEESASVTSYDLLLERGTYYISMCIEDPYNLGALIRCAECAGAHGIIVPKRHAVGLTPAVTKASAGAIEHMAIAKVSNIATTIEELKEKGLWIFASEAGGSAYYETDFDTPAAIVFGSEGNGVGRLIKERSDFIVSIPMYGKVNSLNVSTAASVILCHAARMQRAKK